MSTGSSRDRILKSVKASQPPALALPGVPDFLPPSDTLKQAFIDVLTAIGGSVVELPAESDIPAAVERLFPENAGRRLCPWLEGYGATIDDPHTCEDVDIMVLPAQFGAAENGACWITDAALSHRVLPFICQNLVLVLGESQIVPNMHAAYDRIGSADYDLGVFIAGPSKTADIEQSLVLGAHGPLSLTVLLVGDGAEAVV